MSAEELPEEKMCARCGHSEGRHRTAGGFCKHCVCDGFVAEEKATGNDDIHVYPLNDLREHVTDGPGCPCNPRVEVVGAELIYVHNAWDHREIVEQAIDIMNGTDEEE